LFFKKVNLYFANFDPIIYSSKRITINEHKTRVSVKELEYTLFINFFFQVYMMIDIQKLV